MHKKPRKKKPLTIPVVLELLRLRVFPRSRPRADGGERGLRILGVIGTAPEGEDGPRKGA